MFSYMYSNEYFIVLYLLYINFCAKVFINSIKIIFLVGAVGFEPTCNQATVSTLYKSEPIRPYIILYYKFYTKDVLQIYNFLIKQTI